MKTLIVLEFDQTNVQVRQDFTKGLLWVLAYWNLQCSYKYVEVSYIHSIIWDGLQDDRPFVLIIIFY